MTHTFRNPFIAAIALIVSAIFFAATTPAHADDVVVPTEKLPAAAQTFIKENFAGQKITRVKYDKDWSDEDYEVRLDDGTQIEFSATGKWREIETENKKALPESVIPPAIREYLKKPGNTAGDVAVEIERKSYGYKIGLKTGKKLKFDRDGKFLRHDD